MRRGDDDDGFVVFSLDQFIAMGSDLSRINISRMRDDESLELARRRADFYVAEESVNLGRKDLGIAFVEFPLPGPDRFSYPLTQAKRRAEKQKNEEREEYFSFHFAFQIIKVTTDYIYRERGKKSNEAHNSHLFFLIFNNLIDDLRTLLSLTRTILYYRSYKGLTP
jgi:hypothetical protein